MKMRLLLALAFLSLASPVIAAQGTGCIPTTGTVSGLSFALDVNAAIAATISSNSGSTAPATDCTAVAIKGQVWLDTSVTPNVWRMYDGVSTWVPIGSLDASNHVWSPPVGGGTATVTAAATTDLCLSPSAVQDVLGTTIITSFGSNCAVGIRKTLIFNAATPLTYNATSLIMPGLFSYTTNAGDVADVVYRGGGNWRIVSITKIDGSGVVNPSTPLGTVLYGDYATIPPKTVYGAGQALSRASYPQYLAAVTRVQTGTETAGNATIASIGNTAGLGAGMPVEGPGINAGCTISSVVANTSITLNSGTCVTGTGSQVITIFLTGYGSGGSGSTVGVKDCQGRVLAGRDGTLGTLTNRLTSSYFGANSAVIGAVGGLENFTMALANLITHTHANTLSDPGHSHGFSAPTIAGGNNNNGGGGGAFAAMSSSLGGYSTNPAPTGVTINNASAGSASPTPMRTVQPTVTAECVVVVLP